MSRVSVTKSLACGVVAIAFQAACATSAAGRAGNRAAPPPVPAALRYSLPKTTVVLELQVERASDSPGKYCDLLDLFFPELEPVAACQYGDAPNPGVQLIAGKMRTSIQGYAVTLKGTPDADRVHAVDFDASWHVERTDAMTFTEGGTLTGAEIQRVDRMGEIILGVLSNAAKIAGRFVFGNGSVQIDAEGGSDVPWERLPGLKENYDILSPTRQQAYSAFWHTAEGKARLVLATRSYEGIVDELKKLDGVLGGLGAQGAQTLIAELRKDVSDRLSDDFLGSKRKDSWNPIYEFTPEAPIEGRPSVDVPLFRLAGCGVSEELRRPVKNTLAVLRCANLNGAQPYAVHFAIRTASGSDAARVTTPDSPDTSRDVLYYVRPEAVALNLDGDCKAGVTLLAPKSGSGDPSPSNESHAACEFVDQPSLIAQWGVQERIPKAGKDWSYNISLFEATGAVKSIKLASKAALDKGTIDSASGIVTTLLDAKDAADAAAKKKADDAAAAADELTVLTRSRQVLDEKSKIKKLCQELGLTSCEL